MVGEDVHAGQTQLRNVLFANLDIFVTILLLLRYSHFLILLDIQITQDVDDPVCY